MGSEEFAMGKYPAETAKAILDVSREVDKEKIIRLHEGLYPPRVVEPTLSADYRFFSLPSLPYLLFFGSLSALSFVPSIS